MDQVHVVRHKVLVEGRSQRQVAKELGIARDTVRKYLTESIPIRKETAPRSRPVWAAVRDRVETLLTESSQWTGGKQRLTATRLHELLVAEGQQVGVTLVFPVLGIAGLPYFLVAAVLGTLYLGYAIAGGAVLARADGAAAGSRWAKRFFLASILYLPLLFGALVIDGRQ